MNLQIVTKRGKKANWTLDVNNAYFILLLLELRKLYNDNNDKNHTMMVLNKNWKMIKLIFLKSYNIQ